MGVINQEDIIGYRFNNGSRNGEIVCIECTEEGEFDDLKEHNIIEQSEIEDSKDIYFCDRCKVRIG